MFMTIDCKLFLGTGRDKSDVELLRELEDILQPKVPVAQRCKVLKELCEGDKISKLEDVSVHTFDRTISAAKKIFAQHVFLSIRREQSKNYGN